MRKVSAPCNSHYTRVTVDVGEVVNQGGKWYYVVEFNGSTSYVRLLTFEIDNPRYLSLKKLECLYYGDDDMGAPKLMQDKRQFIDDLFQRDTVQKFYYLYSAVDTNGKNSAEYHLVSDRYGFKHRLYAPLDESLRLPGQALDLFINDIDRKSKNLKLCLYDPSVHDCKRVSAKPIPLQIMENKVHSLKPSIVQSKESQTSPLLQTPVREIDSHEVHIPKALKTSVVSVPLKLCFLPRGKVRIVREKDPVPEAIWEIHIPIFALDGDLIVVNYNGGICRFDIQDLISLKGKEDVSTTLNPYICSCFVVPVKCIVGLQITAKDKEYMYMLRSAEIPTGQLSAPSFEMPDGIVPVKCQPFILPDDSKVRIVQRYVGLLVRRSDLPKDALNYMANYGVYT